MSTAHVSINCFFVYNAKEAAHTYILRGTVPHQQWTETTAVYTMYKQYNIDRIVHEGVIVSVHEKVGIKCTGALVPFAIGQQGVTITVARVVAWPVICEMAAIPSQ